MLRTLKFDGREYKFMINYEQDERTGEPRILDVVGYDRADMALAHAYTARLLNWAKRVVDAELRFDGWDVE